mmetsp:Transcript_4834/g.7750  ORF Transcript_4834/g.7750 Transcript_4834/m.7750 type:complete len:114 (-) Transcript_4834:651-992(-)
MGLRVSQISSSIENLLSSKLREWLLSKGSVLMVICGFGGVGKTVQAEGFAAEVCEGKDKPIVLRLAQFSHGINSCRPIVTQGCKMPDYRFVQASGRKKDTSGTSRRVCSGEPF